MEQKEHYGNNEEAELKRLESLFGEALGDLPTAEETQEAWTEFTRRHRAKRRRVYLSGFAIAASLALLLWLWSPWQRNAQKEIEVFASLEVPSKLTVTKTNGTITVCTPAATTTNVVLPDGTKVILSASSRLDYPESFGTGSRKVNLIGGARFEVRKDASRPFLVHTEELETRVLGTLFDVSAYIRNSSGITLYRGSVQVSKTANDSQSCRIKPGEQASLNSEGKLAVSKVNLQTQGSWTDGEFFFDNTDLMSVMREIGAWYNTDIVFNSRALLRERIYFRISRHLPLEKVLKALDDLGIARFSAQDGKVYVVK